MAETDPIVSTCVYEASLPARITAFITLPLVAYLCIVGGQAIVEGRAVGYVFWLTLMLCQWMESFVPAFDRVEIAGVECIVGRFSRHRFDLSRVVRWSVGPSGDIRFDTADGVARASTGGVRMRGELLRKLLALISEPPLLDRGWTRMRATSLVVAIGMPTALILIPTCMAGDATIGGFTKAVAIAMGIAGLCGAAAARWKPRWWGSAIWASACQWSREPVRSNRRIFSKSSGSCRPWYSAWPSGFRVASGRLAHPRSSCST